METHIEPGRRRSRPDTGDGRERSNRRCRATANHSRAHGGLHALALTVWVLAACSGAGDATRVAPPYVARPLTPSGEKGPDVIATDSSLPLDAALIEQLPEGTFGPYLGPSSGGGSTLAVWAALTADGGRRWSSRLLDARGAPAGSARDLGPAPNEIGLVSVDAMGNGFLLSWSSSTANGSRLDALHLNAAGESSAGPVALAQTPGEALWLDALTVAGRTCVLWSSLSETAADLYALPLPAVSGAPPGQASIVVRGARAWQALAWGDGIALAHVSTGEPGSVSVAFLDGEGRTLRRTQVARAKRLGAEIDAARAGENLLLAWTEDDGEGPRVRLAALGSDGRVLAEPAALPGSVAEQRLIELVPAGDPRGDALLVWEDLGQAPNGERRLRLAPVSAGARVGERRLELLFQADAPARPEFARKGSSLAVLTQSPACSSEAEACDEATAVPTYAEFGPELELAAWEPVLLGEEGARAADLAWGLRCSNDVCSALGAYSRAPVPLYGVELRARSTAWAARAQTTTVRPPSPLAAVGLAEGEPLADVVAANVSRGVLIASVTQFDESTPYVRPATPAPDGRFAPLRALLTAQALSSDGARGAPQVVSYRARAPGGLALAPAPGDRALLVWTALDRQRPEVFATLLGGNGKSLIQRMVSTGAGEVSQVAALALEQGFVVGWIGDGEGGPQAFALALGSDLNRRAPPRPLTQVPGVATALAFASAGGRAHAALVHRLEHEQLLSVVPLDAAAAPAGEYAPLRRIEGASVLDVALVPAAGGLILAWLERPALGDDDESRAWLVELGADAKPKHEPVSVTSVTGDVTSLRLGCTAEGCHGALDCRPPRGHVLEGFTWSPGGPPPRAERLVWRSTATGDPAAFAVSGAGVFYADRRGQRGLARWLKVGWR